MPKETLPVYKSSKVILKQIKKQYGLVSMSEALQRVLNKEIKKW